MISYVHVCSGRSPLLVASMNWIMRTAWSMVSLTPSGETRRVEADDGFSFIPKSAMGAFRGDILPDGGFAIDC